VFFYGLFMDEALLASRGIRVSGTRTGFADGFELRIGERATLVPCPGRRAFGVLMEAAPGELGSLYAEPSVADYVAETLEVTQADGSVVPVLCYNLPAANSPGRTRNTPRPC